MPGKGIARYWLAFAQVDVAYWPLADMAKLLYVRFAGQ